MSATLSIVARTQVSPSASLRSFRSETSTKPNHSLAALPCPARPPSGAAEVRCDRIDVLRCLHAQRDPQRWQG